GRNPMMSEKGDDILISGTTDYDSDAVALAGFLAEWGSSADYATRMATLSVSLYADKPGTHGTVHDNPLADKLYGGTGMDWFFKGMADMYFNRTTDETVTPIT